MSEGLGVSTAAGETRLVYDGRMGELVVLWLKTMLLSLITLGFYRFWGRTRIRKYIWSHTSLVGERFEYDGTGGELFRRFLVALAIVVPLLSVVPVLLLLGADFELATAARFVQVGLFLYLVYIAQYAGRRYRLSRTLWCGMRGGLDGSAHIYAMRAIRYAIAVAITLGIALPWQLVGLWRYEVDNAGFGDVNFRFDGKARPLLGGYLLSWAVIVGGMVVLFVVSGVIAVTIVAAAKAAGAAKASVGTTVAVLMIGAVALYLLAAAWAYLRFAVLLFGHLIGGTRFHRLTFAASARQRDLLRLFLGNLLILAVTLGTGRAFTAQRSVRFLCANLRIHGASELAALTQAPGRRQRRGGEGLVQLLDTGGFA